MFEPNAQDAPMSEIDAELARLESEMPDPARFTACWLGGFQESLGEFADHVQRLLEQLPSLHPVFRGLHLIGNSKKDSPLLAEDLSNLRSWVMRRSWHERVSTNSPYSHLESDGSLTPQSTGKMGFSIDLGNLKLPDDGLRLSVSGGSPIGGSVSMSLPPKLVDQLGSVHFIKQLLQVILDIWPIRCAFTTTRAWHNRVNPSFGDWETLPIGGITYSSDGTLVEALPSWTAWEPFGKGGLLIKVTERPDRLEAQATAAAIAVRESLAAHDMIRLVDSTAS